MLLSVITVVLNCVETIERTIKSIIDQNYEEVEYIIIDGGSVDGTVDVIKKYENKISYWISEPDEGIYSAMNKAINISTGNWIAFINANDWYEPFIFEKIEPILKEKYTNIVYGKVNKIENNKKIGYIGISEKVDYEEIHIRNLYCHQGLFIRKELFNIIGLYDCRYKILADYDWNLRAHAKGFNPKFLDLCVANFTMGGLSSINESSLECSNIVIKNYIIHKRHDYLEKSMGRYAFNYFYQYDICIYKDIMKKCKKYYIWGTGVYGNRIYKIAERFNCNVIGFIDSKPKEKFSNNKKIYLPSKIFSEINFFKEENIVICVASEKYEKDILEVINNYKIPIENYIYISQFFEIALERLGKENKNDGY